MTLKEELEILRGEPISVFDADPKEIPCVETSDPAKLCQHPLVSVHMITYNHEPYIRQAIDGVMMQQTKFEFELIIGEDCSQDNTRKICLEYQKRYPERIRVLWADVNVSKLGGNSRRIRARSRGEFVAICEGDDYWTDPLKLQKQIDVFRRWQNVGLCFAVANSYNQITGDVRMGAPYFMDSLGILNGNEFNRKRIAPETVPEVAVFDYNQIRTTTAMMRGSLLEQILAKHSEVVSWQLRVGDFLLWTLMGDVSDIAFLPDTVAVYRIHPGGITSYNPGIVHMDTCLIALWVYVRLWNYSLQDGFWRVRFWWARGFWTIFSTLSYKRRRAVMCLLDALSFAPYRSFGLFGRMRFFVGRLGVDVSRLCSLVHKLTRGLKSV